MSLSSHHLASGAGWSVSDVVCTAGPRDRAFEERHGQMCIALVTEGTFHYRTADGSAVMTPGSLLLGNVDTCFECGHQHGVGDRCVSFHFSPEFLEPVFACTARGRFRFRAPRLPPLPAVLPLAATAQALRDEVQHKLLDDDGRGSGPPLPACELRPAIDRGSWSRGDYAPHADALHELTLRLAAVVCSTLSPNSRARRLPTHRDEKRVATALRMIEAEPHQRHSLNELASEAATSPYHFLRVFEQVVGVTPGQYVLRTRLRRAAVLLRTTTENIATVALNCGFSDLSTFNRHFRRLMGVTPSAFRTGVAASRRFASPGAEARMTHASEPAGGLLAATPRASASRR